MKTSGFCRLSIVALPLLLMAVPASAQRGKEREKEKQQQQARPAEQPRQQARPAEQPRQRAEQRREAAPPRAQAPAREQAQPRQQSQPRVQAQQPRVQAQPQVQAQPRVEAQRRAPENRGAVVGTRGAYAVPPPQVRQRAYVEPRTYGYARPRAAVPVITYPRAYYSFRPRFSLGFGIYLGYPVGYPFNYGYPRYVYGAPAGYVVTPNTYGGVSFDVTPDDAEVIVDGSYVGLARDFGPFRQPLTLWPGRHHIELQAPGLEPIALDVDVIPGEVVPFRGTLLPY